MVNTSATSCITQGGQSEACDATLYRPLSGVCLSCAVLQVSGGKYQDLPNVLRLQFRIVPKKVVPVWIQSNCFHHAPDAATREYTVDRSLVKIPSDLIEATHHYLYRYIHDRQSHEPRAVVESGPALKFCDGGHPRMM